MASRIAELARRLNSAASLRAALSISPGLAQHLAQFYAARHHDPLLDMLLASAYPAGAPRLPTAPALPTAAPASPDAGDKRRST